jgi:hypothetical protein
MPATVSFWCGEAMRRRCTNALISSKHSGGNISFQEIFPPLWLPLEHRRRWHTLFLDQPVDVELVAAIYLELVDHYAAAVEALGDAEPYDDEGRPVPAFQVIREAGAAMFQLQQALGFPPWRLFASNPSS